MIIVKKINTLLSRADGIFNSTTKKTQENVKGFALFLEQVRSVSDENV